MNIDYAQAQIDIADAKRHLEKIKKLRGVDFLSVAEAVMRLLQAEKKLAPPPEIGPALTGSPDNRHRTFSDEPLGYEAGSIWSEDELFDNRQRVRDIK